MIASIEAQRMIVSNSRDDVAFEMEGVGIVSACQKLIHSNSI